MDDPSTPEIVTRILEAAQQRFARFGLKKTSMQDIADDIGMSKASLYYYFNNKEDLFSGVVKKEQAEFLGQIDGIISTDATAEKVLQTYATKRLVYFQNLLNLSKLNQESLQGVKPIFNLLLEEFRKQETALIAKVIRKGMETGEFRKVDVAYHSDLFISLLQGLRRNLIMKKDLAHLTEEDYKMLKKQFASVAQLFAKGIKTDV